MFRAAEQMKNFLISSQSSVRGSSANLRGRGDPEGSLDILSWTSDAFEEQQRRELSADKLMFGPSDTANVKDYADAVSFCTDKGMELASKTDYCSSSGATPFGGVKTGEDQWAPFSGGGNEKWIQIGTHNDALCQTHMQRHGVPPGGNPPWDADGAKQPWEANYILCVIQPKVMYGPPDTANVKDYAEAEGFCTSKGKQLASKTDYCSSAGATPFGGTKTGEDQWAPFSGGGNEKWIQIGTHSDALCQTHMQRHGVPPGGNPPWDADGAKQPWEANYVLCVTAPLVMYGPPDTANVKDYAEAESFCTSKGMELPSRTDICAAGGTPYGGVRTGEDQWVPYKGAAGGDSWVEIGDATDALC